MWLGHHRYPELLTQDDQHEHRLQKSSGTCNPKGTKSHGSVRPYPRRRRIYSLIPSRLLAWTVRTSHLAPSLMDHQISDGLGREVCSSLTLRLPSFEQDTLKTYCETGLQGKGFKPQRWGQRQCSPNWRCVSPEEQE